MYSFTSALRSICTSVQSIPCLIQQSPAFFPARARWILVTSRSFSTPAARPMVTTMGVAKVENAIIKSAEDKREYRGLELVNGMKVLLISDSATDKSAAALDVNIGHMSDPTDLPGLAHFCEHMLFLGTEKYPEENEYNKFLNEHGGGSNAFTSAEHTNFFFDVAPEHLAGALDRFAQFFLAPLFTASATEREVNAVNSENDKNLQSDNWRLFQLDRSTSKEDHAYNCFGTGNKDTLETLPKQQGIDTRDELLKFHKKNYSSNVMGLCVLGKETLDELQEMVVPLFENVENKKIDVPEWPESPYGEKQIKKQAHVIPVKDIRSLSVTWPIPDLQPHYKSNPGHYLGHLIGHEGPGSLLSELKARGWVNQLVGGQKCGAKGFMFFIVNVDLSEEGIEHTDDIITLIFQYLNLLRNSGPQEWVFQECKDLSAMQFRFKDKERPRNYASHCGGILHDYPLVEVLSGGLLLEEYRTDLINMCLDHLVPEKIRVAVIGQRFIGQTDSIEKWYGTEYSIRDIPEETIKTWQNAGTHEKLKLPTPNEFIPTNFGLMPQEEKEQYPGILKDTPMSRVWFKQDDKFLLPKACVSIELTSLYAYLDPLSTDLTFMFVTLFRDALNEYAYSAELAGLGYDLHNTVYGLTLSLRGYNDKLHVLLKRVIEKMTSFTIDPQRFEVLKDNYVRALKNFRAEQPHQHAVYYTALIMSETMWTKEELLEATEELTVERLQAFIPLLLSKVYLEFLIYGNFSRDQAMKLSDIVESTLITNAQAKPLLSSQQKRFREVQLDDDSSYVFTRSNDVHKSSSTLAYYQCGVQDTSSNMLLELFCQVISEPCFNQLRTQEQLGYIVFSGVRRASGVQGLRIIVQSDKDPSYVGKRVEAFLHSMEAHIDEMTQDVYDNHIKALSTRRLELPKKMSSQNAKFWSEIVSQHYNFDRDSLEVEHLKTITKDDLRKFYKTYIACDAEKRHKFCVLVYSTANGNGASEEAPASTDVGSGDAQLDGLKEVPVKEGVEIDDIHAFKRSLGLFPLPKPFINIKKAASKL